MEPELGRGNLLEAARKGRVEIAKDLLEGGADMRAGDNIGRTALHLAGNAEIVQLLLDNGADVETRDHIGRTALNVAAYEGNNEKVEVLLKANANKDAGSCSGRSPLVCACQQQHLHVVETLLEAGAGVNLPTEMHYPPLHTAARYGGVDIVRALLGKGANVNMLGNPRQETPLMSAFCMVLPPNLSVVEALLAAGADTTIRETRGGMTALHLCVDRCLVDHASLLLRWGADEKAVTGDPFPGKTCEDLLDDQDEYFFPIVKSLLDRAPADRAWRRRGWLVILTSRRCKIGCSSGDGGSSSDAGARSVKRRVETVSVDLVAMVAQLGGEMDGVFRKIVSFL